MSAYMKIPEEKRKERLKEMLTEDVIFFDIGDRKIK